MLLEGEVFRQIRAVNITPILSVLNKVEFRDSEGECAHLSKRKPGGSCVPKEVDDLVDSLGLGGVTRRVFLRKLMPHQGIMPHTDDWVKAHGVWSRFQIPLTTHPDIKMRWPEDDVEIHLELGFLYQVCFDRLHEVVNQTDHERIHIQIDQEDATI